MRIFKSSKFDLAALIAASVLGGTLVAGDSEAADTPEAGLTDSAVCPETFTFSSHDRNARFTGAGGY